MKKFLELLIWLGVLGTAPTSFAQKAAAVAAPPALTKTETVALQSVVQRNQQMSAQAQELAQELMAIEADIRTTHPGYHLDRQTLTLVKDAEKQGAAEPAKAAK